MLHCIGTAPCLHRLLLSRYNLWLIVVLQALVTCPRLRAEPVNVGTAKQVFLDGRFINGPQGVELVVNRPRLDREQLLVPEHPWENQLVGGYTSVIQEGNRIHLWYEARTTDGAWNLAYAYSTDDGATFIKPKLGVIEFAGSTANNLVLDNSLGAHVFPMGPGSPKSEKYGLFIHIRANANNWKGREDFNGAFVSPDGIHWTPKGDVPFWKRGGDLHLDTQNVIFWDTRLKRYVAFPRLFNGQIGRAVGRSESDTFGNFSKPTRALVRDAEDKGIQFYSSAAIQYPFAADAYFAFPAMLNGESGPVDVQFAASRDGVKWLRPDRRPIIHTGFDRAGNEIPYEKGSLYAGYGFTRKGDEISLYYTTLACRHVIPPPGTGIVTRAIYRLDGFTSVDAGEPVGEFTTPAIVFDGERLEINFSTSGDGWVEVGILDAQGKPLPGYGTAKVDRIAGDSVAHVVTWGGRHDVCSLQDRPVRLRFRMRNTKLYAFQFVTP